MTEKLNGSLEEFGAIIGFEATARLSSLLGPGHIYIPDRIIVDHPITRIIGPAKMRHLVEAMGGQTVWLAGGEEFERLRTVRLVAKLLHMGVKVPAIADLTATSPRQVARYRVQAEELGLVQVVMGQGVAEAAEQP